MENILLILHKSLFTGIIFLSFFQAFILLAHCKNSKPQKTMAYVLILWGTAYILPLINLHISETPLVYPLFRVKVLITGNFFIFFMLFFPMQVLIPGWLNWKRILTLSSPIVLLATIYYLGLNVLHQTPEKLMSYTQIFDSFWHFNVWFRFILLLCNLIYMFFVLKWLYGYEKKYIEWKNDNFSDQDYKDISWMRAYGFILAIISIFYLIVLSCGGRLAIIVHSIVVTFSYAYIFYKAIFYESPYPENFFAKRDNEDASGTDKFLGKNHTNEKESEINEMSFESRINDYKEIVTSWMEQEKPYLYKDFKLTDVTRVLPLNRSYLSRVFNEGYGQNFSEVIRSYRIEHAKILLMENPNLPLYEIAELSGFNSDSTFIRAFKLVTGVTPTQYKLEHCATNE